MSIKINQNIFSLLVQRNLTRTTQNLEQSYERLSSGERINRSADDPAGLATSDQLRYEKSGLQQAQKNISGAFSLIGTAESYLESISDQLQRARVLAVQAGNDTLTQDDRLAIQTELDQIIDEVNRIASSAKYADQSLLNGQLQGGKIQIGTTSAETLSLSLGDFRSYSLGARVEVTSDVNVPLTPLGAGQVSINGVAVPVTVSDGVSSVGANSSALAKANAINQITSSTGVEAEALPATVTGVSGVSAVNIDGAINTLSINGVAIGPMVVSAGDSTGALVSEINTKSAQTGVVASLDAAGQLVLTADDGRNIDVQTTGSIGDELGLTAANSDYNQTVTGQVMLYSTRSFTLSDPSGLLGMTTPTQTVAPNLSTAIDSMNVNSSALAGEAIRTLDTAIAQVTAGRSVLGASYNRLESLNDTISQRIEDLSSADERIRDADYAFETARYSQSEILQEAAIAMLTQANTAPRRALELLQG